MKKTMIAVFAVLAAASVAGAQEIKMDFDGSGSGLSFEKLRASRENVVPAPVSKGIIDPFEGENPGELNHFKKGKRCISGNCESGYPGENCNIHTCGSKTAPEKPVRAKENKEVKSLGDMLSQLDGEAQQKFYSSLRFRNGALIDVYTKDIRNAAGERGVAEIIRYFLPETQGKDGNRAGCKPGDKECTEDSYIDDARCIMPHTCVDGYPGSTCTEAC